MALALMVRGLPTLNLVSGAFPPPIGYSNYSSTEATGQVSTTEGATFSNLRARVYSGGSGTNTFQFRDTGLNGNLVASVAGTGVAEDLTHTDVLTAGDTFGTAYTDTGTNSGTAWLTCNVSFASGHGCFHGAADGAGVVHDIQSATRFIALSGRLPADGVTTEDNAAWKARGYTTFEALQVRVSANARTNNSIFKNRINNADGTGSITYAAAETGLKTATGLADAITDGQTINASLTLDTGIQDLTVNFVCATLKSTDTEQDAWSHDVNGLARAASATAHYFTLGGLPNSLTALTEANARVRPGFAGTAKNLRCYLSANTYGGAGTLKLMQNGVAVITTTITAGGGAGWYENTTDSVSFDADDEFSLEFDEGTSGSITIHAAGLTLAVSAGGSAFSSAGTGEATLAGASTASSALSSTGTGTATMAGASLGSGALSVAGVSTVSFDGAALAFGALESQGTGEATWVGDSQVGAASSGAFAMDGSASVEWAGASLAAGEMQAQGVADVDFEGAELSPAPEPVEVGRELGDGGAWARQSSKRRRRLKKDDLELQEVVSTLAPALMANRRTLN